MKGLFHRVENSKRLAECFGVLIAFVLLVPIPAQAEDSDTPVQAETPDVSAQAEESNAPAPAESPKLPAQVKTSEAVKVNGQYRPRIEVNDKALGAEKADVSVSHRARIGLSFEKDGYQANIQIQDVRQWGTEPNTLAVGTGAIDFHQAYVQGALLGTVQFKLGRQEIAFDDQRLMGSVNWTQQGRTFDGVRLSWAKDGYSGDLFAAYLQEGGVRDKGLSGLHLGYKMEKLNSTLLTLLEKTTANKMWRLTVGPRFVLTIDDLSVDLNGYYQAGSVGEGDAKVTTGAFMANTRIAYALGDAGKPLIGLDYLSGDDGADNKNSTFDPLYGTHHKWLGHMDYFLLPHKAANGTAGLGIMDITAGYGVKVTDVTINVGVHYFMTAKDAVTIDANGDEQKAKDLGFELDTSFAYPLSKSVKAVVGYSLFRAGEAMVNLGRAKDAGDIGNWGWGQLIASF